MFVYQKQARAAAAAALKVLEPHVDLDSENQKLDYLYCALSSVALACMLDVQYIFHLFVQFVETEGVVLDTDLDVRLHIG